MNCMQLAIIMEGLVEGIIPHMQKIMINGWNLMIVRLEKLIKMILRVHQRIFCSIDEGTH